MFSSVFFGLSSLTFAEAQGANVGKDWRWEKSISLFPHTPGTRWVYTLSGKQYASGGELQVEVKGQQSLPHLKQEALLVEETYPSTTADAFPEVMPVFYYPRQGYLVRDTAHIYSNPQRTSFVSTGNLGEAVAPILPLDLKKDGTDWLPVDDEHWGTASRLDVTSHFRSEKEAVVVKAGTYPDCMKVEGTVTRGDGSGYRYQEWYAPGVGLVKATTTDLQSGAVLVRKELVSVHTVPTKN
jgi:hypothetical protein